MFEFDYLEPKSVSEASQMLADIGEDARLIAGGTALMLALRQRILRPTHLISLSLVQDLHGISLLPNGDLRIGALSRHCDIADSLLVRKHHPTLAQLAGGLANPQVRNQGTVGGNLCYADPATDPPGFLLALGAKVVLASTQGERILDMSEFLVDYYTTALHAHELLVAICVPRLETNVATQYSRYLRTAAEHRPLLNVSTQAVFQHQTCVSAKIVIGASTAIPMRCTLAENHLQGKSVTRELIEQAASLAAQQIDPISDYRGSQEYRREIAEVVTRRNLCALFGPKSDE